MTQPQFVARVKRWLRRTGLAAVQGFVFLVCVGIHKAIHWGLMEIFPVTEKWTRVKDYLEGMVALVFIAIYLVLLFDTAALFIPGLSKFKENSHG